MLNKLLLISTLSILIFGCKQVPQRSDLTEINLKDSVKEVRISEYYVEDKFGVISKGSAGVITYIKFNDHGNKLEESKYLPSGQLSQKVTYKYDEEGKKLETLKYDSNGNLLKRVKHIYDKEKRLIEHLTTSDIDGKGIVKSTFAYDQNNNIIEWNRFDNNSKLINKDLFKYNEQNQIIEHEHFLTTVSFGVTQFLYDKDGNPKQITKNGNSDTHNETTFEYEFDSKRNWIKAIRYENSIPKSLTERLIVYY